MFEELSHYVTDKELKGFLFVTAVSYGKLVFVTLFLDRYEYHPEFLVSCLMDVQLQRESIDFDVNRAIVDRIIEKLQPIDVRNILDEVRDTNHGLHEYLKLRVHKRRKTGK